MNTLPPSPTLLAMKRITPRIFLKEFVVGGRLRLIRR